MKFFDNNSVAGRKAQARLRASLLSLFAVTIFAWTARNLGHADASDGWWLRARFSLAERLRPASPDPDIVLVDIDDQSVARWPEPLILWGPHLAAAIARMQSGGVRVIGLDWLQPVSADSYFPKHDAPLEEQFSKSRNLVLVKELATDGQNWIRPAPELLYALPDSAQDPDAQLGYANLAGTGSVVTAAEPVFRNTNGTIETAFASRVVERMFGDRESYDPHFWRMDSGANHPGSVIPLRADGTFLIDYRSGSGPIDEETAFTHFSLCDVTEGKVPSSAFRNKVVLVGSTFRGFNDDQNIPFLRGLTGSRLEPGVEGQANVLRTLLNGVAIHEFSSGAIATLAVLLAACLILVWSRMAWAAAALATFALSFLWAVLSLYFFVWHCVAVPLALPLACSLLTSIMMGGYRALGEERERRLVLGLWGRYQDPRLVDYLLEHPTARGGEGTEAEVTVLFADLKNFTKTVEHLEPAESLQVLNRYLSLMTDIIRDEFGGVVDKYLGDGLMAQWGAPQPWEAPQAPAEQHHAIKGVRAALELQRRARELTSTIAGNRDVTFELRLTLHSGPVVVGWVGAERIEFTIIGDTVNVCARMQETAKELGCEFLISESTYYSVREFVRVGQEADVPIRGRDKALRVFEILDQTYDNL